VCAESQYGIELQFGNVIGDHLQNQALLIKTAWCGSGLTRNFHSSGSGGKAGGCHTQMVENVNDTLKNLKTHFPGDDETTGYEIAGFAWFTGWNDAGMKDYEETLVNLIKNLRNDLGVPNMLVIICELGVGGPTPLGKPESRVRKHQFLGRVYLALKRISETTARESLRTAMELADLLLDTGRTCAKL
jgi:hypothetical protein